MKRTKRLLAGLLCAVLLIGLVSITALAADAPWASTAVTALNSVYGSNTFSAEDAVMTESDLSTLIQTTGWKVDDDTQGQAEGDLTRGKACEVLAYAFDLPVTGGSSAIQYLYNQHIINGKDASGTLAEDDAVTKAEFAVITYRVLNFVGGGLGSSTDLKPGTKEYFSLLYLAYRVSNLPMNTLNTQMSSVTGIWTQVYNTSSTSAHQWGYTELGGEELWKAWAIRLNYLKNKSDTSSSTIEGVTYNGNDTLIAAAVKIVDAYIADGGSKTIFSDVTPGSWCYDGVVYLADRGIVTGFGDGMFGPEVTEDPATVLTRAILAVLLFRADEQTVKSDWLQEAKDYAETQGYMTPDSSVSNWWDGTPTREEVIVAIMKAKAPAAAANTNTAILDRFSDAGSISADARPYVAYAVSLGIVNGDANNELNPTGQANRGTAGILLYRTLLGADKTKMKDYADDVSYATGAAQAQTFAMRTARAAGNTLTLREDWRLTSNLDLNVPAGTTLTINGGHYIYEMGGKLINSGTGEVTFQNATLYPAAGDTDAADITPVGAWDAGESNQLMLARRPHSITVAACTNGTVTANALTASKGTNVTLTVTPDSGYELDTLTVTTTGSSEGEEGKTVSVSNNSFTMPASDVTVKAIFERDSGGSSSGGSGSSGGGSSSDGSDSTSTTTKNPDGSTTTKTENKSTGTVTETTRNPDGSWTKVETKKDGTVTTTETDKAGNQSKTVEKADGSSETTVTQKNGTTATVITDADGQTEATVSLSGKAVDIAQESGGAVTLPIPAITDATPVEISLPRSSGEVKVEIPAEHTAPGTVAVIVAADGTETVVKKSIATEDGVTLTLKDSVTVKIVDNSKSFSDVDADKWYSGAVAFVSARNLFSGVGDGLFEPDGTMTRGMAAVMLRNLEDNPDSTIGNVFADVPDGAWYMDGIQWAAEQNIISGYGDGRFGPDDNITREQFAVMLWRYSGCPAADQELNFTDADQVGDYALEAMRWAVENGVLNGYGDGRLGPQGQATRAQVAQMLKNYLEH